MIVLQSDSMNREWKSKRYSTNHNYKNDFSVIRNKLKRIIFAYFR